MEDNKIVEQEVKEEVRKLTEPEMEKVVGGAPQGVQSGTISQVDGTVRVPTESSSLPYCEY